MDSSSSPDLDRECFFIAPIGPDGSEIRDRSDGVMNYVVSPAAEKLGLVTIRADKIARPGRITRQVIDHVVGAKAAVVDLTGANPNVYYEMAVRHTARLPTVLIAEADEELPFDIAQMRTIFFDHTSLKSAADCRDQITEHLGAALGGEVDSPLAASVTINRLEQGTSQEQVLAQLIDGITEIRVRMAEFEKRLAGGLNPFLEDLFTTLSIDDLRRIADRATSRSSLRQAILERLSYIEAERAHRARLAVTEAQSRLASAQEAVRQAQARAGQGEDPDMARAVAAEHAARVAAEQAREAAEQLDRGSNMSRKRDEGTD